MSRQGRIIWPASHEDYGYRTVDQAYCRYCIRTSSTVLQVDIGDDDAWPATSGRSYGRLLTAHHVNRRSSCEESHVGDASLNEEIILDDQYVVHVHPPKYLGTYTKVPVTNHQRK